MLTSCKDAEKCSLPAEALLAEEADACSCL